MDLLGAYQRGNLELDKNAKDIFSAIKKTANYRNQILYASPKGIPSLAEPIDRYLIKRKNIIFLNLAIFLLIDPYSEIQLFVQQALAALLKMLNIISDIKSIIEW